MEAVWGVITPKNVTNDSEIQKIACCSFYYKPKSRHKKELYDHISEAYNVLSTKYGKGLHFILAGDANGLQLDPITDLSSNLVQIVNNFTRMNICYTPNHFKNYKYFYIFFQNNKFSYHSNQLRERSLTLPQSIPGESK